MITDEDRVADWDWAKWLPHTINVTALAQPARLIAANPSQTAAVLDVLAAPSVTSIEGEARQRSTLLVVDSTLPTRLRGSEGKR